MTCGFAAQFCTVDDLERDPLSRSRAWDWVGSGVLVVMRHRASKCPPFTDDLTRPVIDPQKQEPSSNSPGTDAGGRK